MYVQQWGLTKLKYGVILFFQNLKQNNNIYLTLCTYLSQIHINNHTLFAIEASLFRSILKVVKSYGISDNNLNLRRIGGYKSKNLKAINYH